MDCKRFEKGSACDGIAKEAHFERLRADRREVVLLGCLRRARWSWEFESSLVAVERVGWAGVRDLQIGHWK